MEDVYIIILSIFILMLLVLLTSFILKKLVLDVNNEAKKKYLLNILKYDEETKDSKEKENPSKVNNCLTNNVNSETEEGKIYISDVQYKKEGILKEAKKIESRFNLDNETIIKHFLEYRLTKEDIDTYQDLVNTYDILRKLKPNTLVKSVNKEVIFKKVPKRVSNILEPLYCTSTSLNILKVLDTIEEEIRKYDPSIYVYAGNNLKDYKYLNERIITKCDSNIYRGVKIYYHNQMYDYSIE